MLFFFCRRELFIGSDDNLVHVQANKFADDSMQVNISTKAAPVSLIITIPSLYFACTYLPHSSKSASGAS